jgi:hypothetical protein
VGGPGEPAGCGYRDPLTCLNTDMGNRLHETAQHSHEQRAQQRARRFSFDIGPSGSPVANPSPIEPCAPIWPMGSIRPAGSALTSKKQSNNSVPEVFTLSTCSTGTEASASLGALTPLPNYISTPSLKIVFRTVDWPIDGSWRGNGSRDEPVMKRFQGFAISWDARHQYSIQRKDCSCSNPIDYLPGRPGAHPDILLLHSHPRPCKVLNKVMGFRSVFGPLAAPSVEKIRRPEARIATYSRHFILTQPQRWPRDY